MKKPVITTQLYISNFSDAEAVKLSLSLYIPLYSVHSINPHLLFTFSNISLQVVYVYQSIYTQNMQYIRAVYTILLCACESIVVVYRLSACFLVSTCLTLWWVVSVNRNAAITEPSVEYRDHENIDSVSQLTF